MSGATAQQPASATWSAGSGAVTGVGASTRARKVLVQDGAHRPPATFVLDPDGNVTTMTSGARQVLEDLRTNGEGDHLGVVHVAAAKVRWSRQPASVTTRLHGRSGRVYRLHVSPMEPPVGAVAVTAETGRPDDLASIVLESLALTRRETEIALWLCRGLAIKEISAELAISIHTVRDHIKAVYDKAGVRSRAELMALLFTNHIVDQVEDAVTHLV